MCFIIRLILQSAVDWGSRICTLNLITHFFSILRFFFYQNVKFCNPPEKWSNHLGRLSFCQQKTRIGQAELCRPLLENEDRDPPNFFSPSGSCETSPVLQPHRRKGGGGETAGKCFRILIWLNDDEPRKNHKQFKQASASGVAKFWHR